MHGDDLGSGLPLSRRRKYPLGPGHFTEAFAAENAPRPSLRGGTPQGRLTDGQPAFGGSTNWVTMRFAASFGSPLSRMRSMRTSITTVLRPT
jgi:hypothetical protein